MNKKKLYIGNLHFTIDTADLSLLFAPYGALTDAIVIKNRETKCSRGFGFVTFASSREAANALKAMQGKKIKGRPLRLLYAEKDPQKPHQSQLFLQLFEQDSDDLILVHLF
jgi:RNA recognition motif-containing protein